ncbi:helix-turn-helix domain-containing protein [Cytophagaceae bacterium YF14B1]|uniref:Helix-turn-helix domain-containing protein n=1 Tax=Xanthocytophaga flava TaxID=3048013 RepID=A0AAE3QT61_9BACT|nr:helix-turn-helix domain-containing protein [Xanthocytophaga flavus]MDJ1482228.1 helix-turn-helix domain-containing protein [Xanthocytophaga flavus]
MRNRNSKNTENLPIQALLENEYVRITRLHKDLNSLSVVPHRHDHYELMLVTEGEGRHSINFKSYDIKPDRLYFLHPGQVHLIESFERDGWLILFGEELFKRFLAIHTHEDEHGLLDSYTPHPYVDLDEKLKGTFILLIDQLQTELSAKKPDVDISLHYVSLLLLYANKAQIVQHPKAPLPLVNKQLFHRLKLLIEQHYRQQHLAAFYAETLHTDIKKLNKICREATGFTVFELLQERLVTESKIRLQTSTGSVKEISYDLGFNDPAFFGRFFKKHTGITPAEFRNRRMI